MRWIGLLILALALTQCSRNEEIESGLLQPNQTPSKTENSLPSPPPAEPELKTGQTFGLAYAEIENWDKAITHLNQEVEKAELVSIAPELYYQLGYAYLQKNQWSEAKKAFSYIVRESPQYPRIDLTFYYLSQISAKEGNPVEADSWRKKIEESYSNSLAFRYVTIDLALQEKEKQNYLEAWKLLSQVLWQSKEASLYQRALPPLRELTQTLFFSNKKSTNTSFEYYTVQSGDNLSKISKKYQMTPGFLMYLNRLSSSTIRIGQFLKVFQGGPVSVQVHRDTYTLVVFCGDRYICDYPIGLGKQDKTPDGEFEIDSKVENPDWYADGKVYAFGDPQNVLGTRWLGFKNQPGVTGFGIHGTADPSSIGKKESNGCVRMRNEQVEELFTMIPVGSKVAIY